MPLPLGSNSHPIFKQVPLLPPRHQQLSIRFCRGHLSNKIVDVLLVGVIGTSFISWLLTTAHTKWWGWFACFHFRIFRAFHCYHLLSVCRWIWRRKVASVMRHRCNGGRDVGIFNRRGVFPFSPFWWVHYAEIAIRVVIGRFMPDTRDSKTYGVFFPLNQLEYGGSTHMWRGVPSVYPGRQQVCQNMRGKLWLHECTCSNSAFWLFMQKIHHTRR